jgi:hypothetical protein
MIRSIEDYLARLRSKMKGCDPAVIQDALADAEDHLRAALGSAGAGRPETGEEAAAVFLKYGDPAEVAAAYRELESRFPPALPESRPGGRKSAFSKFVGVFADPRTWGAFLYMLLTGITGLIYAAWVLTGGTAALISMLVVIGVPLAALFLLSVRGLALLDGRLVEALLGVRMPRRPLFLDPGLKGMDRLKALFTDARTWKALVYTFLQFPLGLIYLLLCLGLPALALAFAAAPVLELIFHLPLDLMGTDRFTPPALLPFVSLAGFAALISILHVVKWIGRVHARYARAVLLSARGEDDVPNG